MPDPVVSVSGTERGHDTRPGVGDEVRFVHNWERYAGFVTSIDEDGVMVCMPIGTGYELRGPIPLTSLERLPDVSR